MTDDRISPENEASLLAAEYALGLLDPAARRDAEARAARDPEFAAHAQAWAERLAPLAEEVGETEPPPELWRRIESRLEPQGAANDNARALRRWRALAYGASGLAAASLAAVVLLLARPVQPAAQVAALTTPQGATALVAAFDARTGALLVTPGPGLQAFDHTPHLWLVNPDGGVQLVGAIDPAKSATHALPRPLARKADAAVGLALSLEPAGHRPIDRPGGPTVATGTFDDL